MEAMAMNMGDIISRVGAPPANTDQSALLYKLADAVGEKEAQDTREDLPLNSFHWPASPATWKMPWVLSNVNMKWSPQFNSWHSVGNIGVANILDTEINDKLEGYLK